MTLILFALLLPFIVFVLRSALGKSVEFTKLARISRLVFVLLILLFIGLLQLEKINYYLVGYRSTAIFFLITAVAGVVYTLSDRRYILFSLSRIILNLAVVILLIGSFFVIFDLFANFGRNKVYSDSKFRLEYPGFLFLTHCRLPDLYVKKGLIERKTQLVKPDTCIFLSEVVRVNIEEKDSSYYVTFHLATDSADSIPLMVHYNKWPGQQN
jgi:hypothetical protein